MDTGIPEEQINLSVRWLNHLISDTYVLFVKTRNFHWNVEGMQFMELHKYFQEIYEMLDDQGDTLAERVRALNARPLATMAEWLEESELKETENVNLVQVMLENLISDLEHIVQDERKAANDVSKDNADMSTNNMLISFMEQHEKVLWMLRSYLK